MNMVEKGSGLSFRSQGACSCMVYIHLHIRYRPSWLFALFWRPLAQLYVCHNLPLKFSHHLSLLSAEDSLRLLDHLSSDGRHAHGQMGLANLRVYSSLELAEEPMSPPQSAPSAVVATHKETTIARSAPKTHNAASSALSSTHSAHSSHAASKSSKPAQANTRTHGAAQSAPAKTPSNLDKSAAKPQTPPTSHRLPPSTKFAHWTKPKGTSVPAASSSFRGASASHSIRKTLATGAKHDDQVKQNVCKRLGEFVRKVPPASLDTVSSKEAKSAIRHYFDDFDALWKAHKAFFKVSSEMSTACCDLIQRLLSPRLA